MRRFFKDIHIWLSIPLGLTISLICFTGAILVFEKEISSIVVEHCDMADDTGRLEFFRSTQRLHRWLMDTRPENGGFFWGKVVVGITTLATVIITLTGIVLWWPKGRAMWRNRTRIALRKGGHRLLYDLHVAGGIYTTIIILVMALTGLCWSFEWYRDIFEWVVGDISNRALRSIHTGNFGGLATRILWFVGALLGGTLPLTGYYLWIKRKFRDK